MSITVHDKEIELNENGYLENPEDWNMEVAKAIAENQGLSLSDKHWDVINYLREEYTDNGGNQPMERVILKEISKRWGKKLKSKDLYDLFPGAPSKQGNRIAGLPYVARKGGY